MTAVDLLKAKTPRTEAFDKACEARGIGFRGHYEELKRRLESNEPLPIVLGWYEMVPPDDFGITFKGTVLDPLLRHRLRNKLESLHETACWFKRLVECCDHCGFYLEDMSHLEHGMYFHVARHSELDGDHVYDLSECAKDPEWTELLEAREKLRCDQPAVTANGNGPAA